MEVLCTTNCRGPAGGTTVRQRYDYKSSDDAVWHHLSTGNGNGSMIESVSISYAMARG
jgi:hypothetical protein